MSCFGAANTRIGFIFSSMTGQLTDCAARAKEGTDTILHPSTLSCGDGISSSYILSRLAKTIKGIDRKGDTSNRLEDKQIRWQIDTDGRVLERGQFQSCRVHNVTHHNSKYNLECVLSGDSWTRITQPRQVHASHHLSHEDLRTTKGTPNRWMTESSIETPQETIFPATSRNGKAKAIHGFRQRGQKHLTLLDTSFGHFNSKGSRLVAIQLGFKCISSRQTGRSSHMDQNRKWRCIWIQRHVVFKAHGECKSYIFNTIVCCGESPTANVYKNRDSLRIYCYVMHTFCSAQGNLK